MQLIIHFLISFVSTVGFGIITNIPRRALPVAGLTGALAWSGYITYGYDSLLAWLLVAGHLGTNAENIIVSSVMPLVPGVALTNSLREIMAGHMISGTVRALDALLIAAAIGGGEIDFNWPTKIIGAGLVSVAPMLVFKANWLDLALAFFVGIAGYLVAQYVGRKATATPYAKEVAGGFTSVSCYVTLTAVFVSLADQPTTQLTKTKLGSFNLQKVDEINHLSRQFVAGDVDFDDVTRQVNAIDEYAGFVLRFFPVKSRQE
ncbi:threonine/serine exporter family protein [Weissella confusa]|uniref:Threonine/serine exporter family protein n=1 Tax=Weissella confusa TaxID=1583 RepID=A0A923NF81_WEICO|nr:threonine/serine exporter family protein [Weissella confusa]